MFHFALVVDARGAGYDGMIAVAKLQERSPLESNAVLTRAVEMRSSIEITLLFRQKTLQSIASELNDSLRVGRISADAGGGDVVCLGHQAVLREVFPAGKDETFILRVDITDEKPCADAMVFEGHLMFVEEFFVVFQEVLCLAVTAAFCYRQAHRPQVFVAVVTYDGGTQTVRSRDDFRAALQVEPRGEFASVEWRLLNVRDGASVVLRHEWPLVGSIREEVPFEDGLCSSHVVESHQFLFCQNDATELLFKRFALRFDVQNSMIFSNFPFRSKRRQFDCDTEFFYAKFVKLHGALCDIGCKDTTNN